MNWLARGHWDAVPLEQSVVTLEDWFPNWCGGLKVGLKRKVLYRRFIVNYERSEWNSAEVFKCLFMGYEF